ncbi:MAG: sulfurtransferase TusA family protein [Kofleriaceae bacterium]
MTSSSTLLSTPIESSRGDAMTPDATIDLAGEVCPFTFVRTKLAMEALPMGGTLRVIVDHEPAIRNIPRSAREWGQEILSTGEHGAGRWRIDLRRLAR